jgi:hypothetical protein
MCLRLRLNFLLIPSRALPSFPPMATSQLAEFYWRGTTKRPAPQFVPTDADIEAELMEALANQVENAIPDDGAIEVDSDEEYTV